MKILLRVISTIIFTLFLGACSDKKTSPTEVKNTLSDVVRSFGYEVIPTDKEKKYFELEMLDRAFYKPLSFESARIRSLKPLDAYHGPVRGDYYLSIEEYSTTEEAKKRADEYRDLSRLVSVGDDDLHGLNKGTVRCWGLSSAKRAYLLTTHASMFSTIESESHSVIDGVKAFEKQRGNEIEIGKTDPRNGF